MSLAVISFPPIILASKMKSAPGRGNRRHWLRLLIQVHNCSVQPSRTCQHIEQSSCGLFVADFELSRAKLFLESFHAALIHLHELKVGWELHCSLTLAAPQIQRLGNACISVLYVSTQPQVAFLITDTSHDSCQPICYASQKQESRKGVFSCRQSGYCVSVYNPFARS